MKENKNATPLPVMMGMIKNELKECIYGSMQVNKMPPGIMVYLLDSIQKDLLLAENDWLNNQFINEQKLEKEE